MTTITTLLHSDYTVGWICALPLEMAAAKAMLEEAAYYRDDEDYLAPLLDFGALINEKDGYGWTALSCSAEYDHVRSAVALLNHGADIEPRDKQGWTPLLRAVNSNSHGVMKLLLERGADCCAVSYRSETILHFAAARGDCETLCILIAAALKGLDSGAIDFSGRTATDIMDSRALQPSDLAAAFVNLLASQNGDTHAAEDSG
jgi:ankyrin repeat protein